MATGLKMCDSKVWKLAFISLVLIECMLCTCLNSCLKNATSLSRWPSVSFMMTSSHGTIFRVTGFLCGEFTGHRWIPLTTASDTELWCFLWSAPEQKLSKQWRRRWFETSSCSLWRHCDVMPRQNGLHVAYDFFKCDFLNDMFHILIAISLKFAPKGPFSNKPSLITIMTCRLLGGQWWSSLLIYMHHLVSIILHLFLLGRNKYVHLLF